MSYKEMLDSSIAEIDSYLGDKYIPMLEECLRPTMRRPYNSGWADDIECLTCGSPKKNDLRCFAWDHETDAKPHFCRKCLRKLITHINLKFTSRNAQCSTCYKKGHYEFVRFENGDTRMQMCTACFIHPEEFSPFDGLREITSKIRDDISKMEIEETKTKKIQEDMKELYMSQGLSEAFFCFVTSVTLFCSVTLSSCRSSLVFIKESLNDLLWLSMLYLLSP